MERVQLPRVTTHRYATPSTTALEKLQAVRDELHQQINEFVARGGKVQEIPYGVQRLGPGKYAVAADDFATTRSQKQRPRKTPKGYIRVSEAAALLGISGAQFSHRVRSGRYQILHASQEGTAYLYKRADILKLKATELSPCKK
jgi:hypothetical protein